MTTEQLEKIATLDVGIAGAGGLGSNAAFNLVRSGFCNFTIVDFDIVEYSNLNRQFFFYRQAGQKKVTALKENLLSVNPDLNIKIHCEKIEEKNVDFFIECDAIIEALDNPKYKKILIENYIDSDKLLVAASGIAGYGKSDSIKINKIKKKFFIVGDMKTAVDEQNQPFSPKVNIAAAKEADIVLEYFFGKE